MPPRLGAELVELVAQRTRRARVAITGTSMTPQLRAGMVVDIEPLAAPPRIGDILVFKTQRGLVAHRLVGGERFAFGALRGLIARPHAGTTAAFVTGGDAQPERVERVPAEHVIGRVSAVWSSDEADAQRIDDRRFARVGSVMARTRRLRVLARKLQAYTALAAGDPLVALPPPAFAALTAATRAFERCEYAAAVARLAPIPRAAVVTMSGRHHLGGLLAQWLDESVAAGVPVEAELHAALRRVRWTNALQAGRVLRCALDVRDRFAAADIPHIFLKGAARLGEGRPGADAQFSGDVDVLVPAALADRALDMLREAGYTDVRSSAQRAGYRTLNHREQLVAPDAGIPVEVHVTLTAPATVSRALDYDDLRGAARTVRGPHGDIRILDDVAAALHLAYHARDLHVWRDIVLLSRLLRGFDAPQRARFDAAVMAEKRDGVRLRSAVAAAQGLTADGSADAAVRRYLAWAELREDLPRRILHIDLIESAAARCPRILLRLDFTQRGAGRTMRRLVRSLIVLPAIVRVARARRHNLSGGG